MAHSSRNRSWKNCRSVASRRLRVERLEDRSLLAITATMSDHLSADLDGDGRADAGETIRYQVTITNDGNEEVVGLRFADMLDPNSTLVPGSVAVSRAATVAGSEIIAANVYYTVFRLTADGDLIDFLTDGSYLLMETVVGPDGYAYIMGWGSIPGERAILRFDAVESALLPVTGIIRGAAGFDFGPNGNIFVVDSDFGNVVEFDRQTGARVGEFVAGIDHPVSIRFAPTGDMYVARRDPASAEGSILRFDGTTGAYLGAVIEGVHSPQAIAFGPSGDLYVSNDGTGDVVITRHDATTGELVPSFAGGPFPASEMLFHPNGELLVAMGLGDWILRYDAESGEYLGEFFSSGEFLRMSTFTGIARTPDVQVDLGTLEAGASVDITFDVIVGVRSEFVEVANQGLVTAADVHGVLRTDDPDTMASADATVTLLDIEDMDFGDAPTAKQSGFAGSYPTRLVDHGARHRIIPDGPYLGNVPPDAEWDAQADARALGDDRNAEGDDEDGAAVCDNFTLAIGRTATATVMVSASRGAARLYGWIDFDGSGTFDADEQIADGTGGFANLEDGPLAIHFAVPNEGFTGTTFARFRITTGTLSGPGGVAVDGEVEDWPVQIVPALVAMQRDELLDDLDGDGQADPGDTVRYEVTITNQAGFDAAGVRFTELLDPNSGLVPGSVKVSRPATVTGSEIFVGGGLFRLDLDGSLLGTSNPGNNAGGMALAPDGFAYAEDLDQDSDLLISRLDEANMALVPLTSNGIPDGTHNFDFGPNGNLFAVNTFMGKIFEFDRATGRLLGDFIAGIDSPLALRFAPSGELFVARGDSGPDAGKGSILRFDGSTGDFLGVVTEEVQSPRFMVFGSDGDLYVADRSPGRRITRLDSTTGELALGFASNLYEVRQMLIHPSGELLAVTGGSSVLRYNPDTGEHLGSFFSAGASVSLSGIVRTPDVQVDLGILEAGTSVRIVFDAIIAINGELAGVSNQGSLTTESLRTWLRTTDLHTAHFGDPTITPVDRDQADFDFGDAPSRDQSGFPRGYSTSLADNGARHRIARGGPFLGSTRPDAEPDGQPDPRAAGDENGGYRRDEDGVVFADRSGLTIGREATVIVTIHGSDGGASLYGWIDFDASGTFDADEQIADGNGEFASLGDGAVGIRFRVPNGGFTGETFARFRVSSDAGLMADGLAEDGEIEDHMVRILPASETASTSGSVSWDGDGTRLVVRGTAGDDVIEVIGGTLAGRWTVNVNGFPREIEAELAIVIEVDGAGGRDQLRLVGTEGAELAALRPNGAIVQGDGYTVLAVHVESTEFEGGGGSDVVRLHGTRRGRALMTYDDPETELTRTELAGDGFLLAATGEQVHVARDRGFRRLSSARIVPASLDRGEGTNTLAAGAIFEEANAPAEVGRRGDPAAQQWQDEWEAVLQMLWMREPEKFAAERSATNKHITSIEEIDRIFARWE